MLKTVSHDLKGYGGFQYPTSGRVECEKWSPDPKCGNGLHGLLWGEGNGGYCNWTDEAKWLVLSVEATSIVDCGEKVKFPAGYVVYVGDLLGAIVYLKARGGEGKKIVGDTVKVGHRGTATAGDWGTATAGRWGTATAGRWGTATAGYRGTATAGDCGTATAGDCGTATAGDCGTATAGESGALIIRWWDFAAARNRVSVGNIGKGGLKPNTKYRLNDKREFEEVQP